MNRLLVKLAITAAAGGLLFSNPTGAQILPPQKRAEHVEITKAPELEAAVDDMAIVRWTTTNPRGDDEHYGVVHYGTDPEDLSQTAKGHIRLNRKTSRDDFSGSHGGSEAADDLLLQGELDGGRWRERWVGEPRQQVHHTGGRRTNPSVPSAKVTATGRAPPWITLTSTPAHRPILRSGTLVDWGRARRRTGHHSVGR
jgi:hypothetical protein